MTWQFRTEGQQLTAFNRADGTRLSFGVTPERLSAPELLDVKLTDVCSVGCAFCYQDSRPERQHATIADVAFIAAEAGKAGLFEVALGGGEVSEYPHFYEALHLFRLAGVVPNFTTRRMRWLAREWPTLRDLVGGVAISVGSAAEIRLLASLIPISERRSGQLVAQVVMGTVERAELLALVQEAGAAGIRVTLLGFKHVGRGETFRPLAYDWWLDDLREYVRHTPISIDTALAAECPAELEKRLVAGSYHTEEGRFSAYVDAVSMTLAPSSYHSGPSFPFDMHWLEAFAALYFVQGPTTPPTFGRVRLGFATNSSSSHSLVLLREPVEDEPQDPAEWADTYSWKYSSFTVSSLEARKYYLAANLMMDLRDFFKEESDPQGRIRELCDLPPNTELSTEGVDLESALQFQPNPDGSGPHPHQFERVKTVLYSPLVSVFGYGDGGWDEDAPRWNAVDFTLDAANFMYMFTLPETFEPVPQRPEGMPLHLYLVGLVNGQRFLKVVQDSLAAGISWEEVKLALLDVPSQKVAEGDLPQLRLKVINAAGLYPPSFLLANPGGYLEDERWQWFRLYLKADPELLEQFMERLGVLRLNHLEFSKRVLDYAAEDLAFAKLDPVRLQKLSALMDDGDAFARAIGTDNSGIYIRFNDYLAKF